MVSQHNWTNTRTYCTDKNYIYRQNTEKNRMFPTPNTKISARSARSQSVICFQLGQKRQCYQLSLKNWWLCTIDQRQGLCEKFQRENYSFYHCWRSSSQAFICSKLKSFRGLRPLGPRQGSWGGLMDPPVRGRAVQYAHGNFPFFFFFFNSVGWGVGWSCLSLYPW